MCWSTDEIDNQLSGTLAHFEIKTAISAINEVVTIIATELHQTLVSLVSENNAFNLNLNKVTTVTISNYFRYIFANAESRAFGSGQELDLVPAVDLINGLPSYCKNINTDHEFTIGDKNVQRLFTCRDIEKGEPFYISYGNLNSRELFLQHGFVDQVDCFSKLYCSKAADSVLVSFKTIMDVFKEKTLTDLQKEVLLKYFGSVKNKNSMKDECNKDRDNDKDN
eukprot:Pgem_evm4s19546